MIMMKMKKIIFLCLSNSDGTDADLEDFRDNYDY